MGGAATHIHHVTEGGRAVDQHRGQRILLGVAVGGGVGGNAQGVPLTVAADHANGVRLKAAQDEQRAVPDGVSLVADRDRKLAADDVDKLVAIVVMLRQKHGAAQAMGGQKVHNALLFA
jgi:hypothetical protein